MDNEIYKQKWADLLQEVDRYCVSVVDSYEEFEALRDDIYAATLEYIKDKRKLQHAKKKNLYMLIKNGF